MLANIVTHNRENDTTTTIRFGEIKKDNNVILKLVDDENATLITAKDAIDLLRKQVGSTIIGRAIISSPVYGKGVNRGTVIQTEPYAPATGHEDKPHTRTEWIIASDKEFQHVITKVNITAANAPDGDLTKYVLTRGDCAAATLYIKCRFISNDFATFWSPVADYKTDNVLVNLPTITVTENQLTPTVEVSTFDLNRAGLDPSDTDELDSVEYGIDEVRHGVTVDSPEISALMTDSYVPKYKKTKKATDEPYRLTLPVTLDDGSTFELSPGRAYLITARMIGKKYRSAFARYIIEMPNYKVLPPEVSIRDNGLTPTLNISAIRTNEGTDTLKEHIIKIYKNDNDNDPGNDELVYTRSTQESSVTIEQNVLKPDQTYTFHVHTVGVKFGASDIREITYSLPFMGIEKPIVDVILNGLVPRVKVSPFRQVNVKETFKAIEWELHDHAVRVDQQGQPLPTLIQSWRTEAPITHLDIPKGVLEMSTNYIVKARYIGTKLKSEWGQKKFKTTEVRVKRPNVNIVVRGLTITADIDEFLVYGEDDDIESVVYVVNEVSIIGGIPVPTRQLGEWIRPGADRKLKIGYAEGIRPRGIYTITAKIIGNKYNSPTSEPTIATIGNIYIKPPTLKITGMPNKVPEKPVLEATPFEVGGDLELKDKHLSTTWTITNTDTNIEVFKEETTDFLTRYKLIEYGVLKVANNYKLEVVYHGELLGDSEPAVLNFTTRNVFLDIPDDGDGLNEIIFGKDDDPVDPAYYGTIPFDKLIGDRDYLGPWNGKHEYLPGQQCTYAGRLWYALDTKLQDPNVSKEHANVNRVPGETDPNGLKYWEVDTRDNLPTYEWVMKQLGFTVGVKDWGGLLNRHVLGTTAPEQQMGKWADKNGSVSKYRLCSWRTGGNSHMVYVYDNVEVTGVSYNDIALHYFGEPRNRTIRVGERLYWVRLMTRYEYEELYRFIVTPEPEEANGRDLTATNGELSVPTKIKEPSLLSCFDVDATTPDDYKPVVGAGGIYTDEATPDLRAYGLRLVLEYIPPEEEPRFYFERAYNTKLNYDRYTDTGFFGIQDPLVPNEHQEVLNTLVRAGDPQALEPDVLAKLDNATKINRNHQWLVFYWHGRRVFISRLPIAYGMSFNSIMRLNCLLPSDIKTNNSNKVLLQMAIPDGKGGQTEGIFDVHIPIAYPLFTNINGAGAKAEDAPKDSILANKLLYRRSMWNELLYRVAERKPLEVDTHDRHGGWQIGDNWANLDDIQLGVFEHYSGNGCHDYNLGIINDPAVDRGDPVWVNDPTKAFNIVSRGGTKLEDTYYYTTAGLDRNDHGLRLVMVDMGYIPVTDKPYLLYRMLYGKNGKILGQ